MTNISDHYSISVVVSSIIFIFTIFEDTLMKRTELYARVQFRSKNF